jgi:DNA uptake protein ComE-like DNA-binding protein
MKTRFNPAYLFVLFLLLLAAPVANATADEAAVPTTTPSGDTASTGESAPFTLTPDEIANLEDAADANAPESDNASAIDDAGNFVSDNAPYFIIGIIVLAAILAGLLILRGRRKDRPGKGAPARAGAATAGPGTAGPGPAPATSKVAGAPASVPSATELRRRKRAAMQRAREEERLRRRAGKGGSRGPAARSATQSPANPVDAEKQAARDQAKAAGAVARTGTTISPPPAGAIPAPVSPSQSAPATGVITPAGTAGATSAEPPQTAPEAGPPPEPIAQAGPSDGEAPSTAVNPLPETDGAEIVAPGPDATVGRAAAAFAAGAAAGAISGPPAAAGDPLEAKVAEIRAAQEGTSQPDPPPAGPASPPVAETSSEPQAAQAPGIETPAAEAPAAAMPPAQPAEEPAPEAARLPERPDPSSPAPPAIPGLSAVERQLSADSIERDRALKEAEVRLQQIERRAEDAERRAAFAERLAQLKLEESERERRLDEVISGIDRAEERAREAEQRAEAAERAAANALEHGSISRGPVSPPGGSEGESALETQPSVPSQAAAPVQTPNPVPAPATGVPVHPAGLSGGISLNQATFEELREAELSVTQATRVLAYRERFGGYSAVEDLAKVPGFSDEDVSTMRGRFTV